MIIKREIRILGWDDGPFPKGKKGKTILVGTIFRGASFMDGILKTDIEIDGTDATESDDPLKGNEQSWRDANRSYFTDDNGSYIAQWNATFNYGDLPSNSLKEVAVAQNITNGTVNGLIRITFDEIILGSGSSVNFQIQISPTQG